MRHPYTTVYRRRKKLKWSRSNIWTTVRNMAFWICQTCRHEWQNQQGTTERPTFASRVVTRANGDQHFTQRCRVRNHQTVHLFLRLYNLLKHVATDRWSGELKSWTCCLTSASSRHNLRTFSETSVHKKFMLYSILVYFFSFYIPTCGWPSGGHRRENI